MFPVKSSIFVLMPCLCSYITDMWLRDITEQVSWSWKLNLSLTKYKISIRQKWLSINNEKNKNHCCFAKWQRVLVYSLQPEIWREIISSISKLEIVFWNNKKNVEAKLLEHYSHMFPLRDMMWTNTLGILTTASLCPIHNILRPINLCVHTPYVWSPLPSSHISDCLCH